LLLGVAVELSEVFFTDFVVLSFSKGTFDFPVLVFELSDVSLDAFVLSDSSGFVVELPDAIVEKFDFLSPRLLPDVVEIELRGKLVEAVNALLVDSIEKLEALAFPDLSAIVLVCKPIVAEDPLRVDPVEPKVEVAPMTLCVENPPSVNASIYEFTICEQPN